MNAGVWYLIVYILMYVYIIREILDNIESNGVLQLKIIRNISKFTRRA